MTTDHDRFSAWNEQLLPDERRLLLRAARGISIPGISLHVLAKEDHVTLSLLQVPDPNSTRPALLQVTQGIVRLTPIGYQFTTWLDQRDQLAQEPTEVLPNVVALKTAVPEGKQAFPFLTPRNQDNLEALAEAYGIAERSVFGVALTATFQALGLTFNELWCGHPTVEIPEGFELTGTAQAYQIAQIGRLLGLGSTAEVLNLCVSDLADDKLAAMRDAEGD